MPDDRQRQPVREALGRRDPDAQPGERARARPDDDAGQPRPPDVLLAEEPPDRRQQRLAVAIPGGPRRDPVDPPVGLSPWRRRPAWSPCRTPGWRGGGRRASRSWRPRRDSGWRSGVPARRVMVRGSSPAPSITTSRRADGQDRGHPVGPLDEGHAGRLAVVDQAPGNDVGRHRRAGTGRCGRAAGGRRIRP